MVYLKLSTPVSLIINLVVLQKGQLVILVIRVCLDPWLCCSMDLGIRAGFGVATIGLSHFAGYSRIRERGKMVLLIWVGGPNVRVLERPQTNFATVKSFLRKILHLQTGPVTARHGITQLANLGTQYNSGRYLLYLPPCVFNTK